MLVCGWFGSNFWYKLPGLEVFMDSMLLRSNFIVSAPISPSIYEVSSMATKYMYESWEGEHGILTHSSVLC